jgi:hypothetical protein
VSEDITKAEFCARFKTRMLAVAGEHFAQEGPDAPESVADYADQSAPSYFDTDWQREEGPEACADADISYWED